VRHAQCQHHKLTIPNRVGDPEISYTDLSQVGCRVSARLPIGRGFWSRRPRPAQRSEPPAYQFRELLECFGIVLNGALARVDHSLKACVTLSLEAAFVRPASRSASRSEATRPSSRSINSSYRATKSAGTIAAAQCGARPRVT